MPHTPGPWGYDPELTDQGAPLIFGLWRGHDERSLAMVQYEDNPLDPEVQANARLIAAAPDLLEAVQRSVQYLVLAIHDGENQGLAKKTLDLARRDLELLQTALTKATQE